MFRSLRGLGFSKFGLATAIVFCLSFVGCGSYPEKPDEVVQKFFFASLNEKFDEAKKYTSGTDEQKKKISTWIYRVYLNGKFGENRDDIELKTIVKNNRNNNAEVWIFVQNKTANGRGLREGFKNLERPYERAYLIKSDGKWKIIAK